MTTLPFSLDTDDPGISPLGLIVLQTDETIEGDFRRLFSGDPAPIYVSRITSDPQVTTKTLTRMKHALPAAADLLPKARPFRVVGYACTSASSVIGSEKVEELVKQACDVQTVTNPLRAAVAQARELGASRFALLSPYVEQVNTALRAAFADQGVLMDVFGTFGISAESKVVRISTQSIVDAAVRLGSDRAVEAVFLSCTNLRTLDAIPQIHEQIDKPVLSSNQALAWHMRRLNTAQNP